MVTQKKKPGLFSRIFQLDEGDRRPADIGDVDELVVDGLGVEDQANDAVRPLIKRSELGTYGTQIYSGYMAEDYLRTLQGRRRADIYDQMRRSDPQLTMCLSAVKNPIKSATWEIEPTPDEGEQPTDEQMQDAAFIKHILFNDMDRTFGKFLSEALTMLDFGHSVFEITNKVVLDHPVFGSYNGIQSLGFRSQRTIERWNVGPNGKLESVTQIASGDLDSSIDIPDEFLIVFTLNQEGANYEGISLMRPCYGAWIRKDLYLKLIAIGIEKFAVPTPLVEIPTGKENSDQARNLIAALASYTSHESNYLTYPAGWKIDLKSTDFDPSKVEQSVDSEDKRIAKAFLANFLELGLSGGGAFALSNDLSDFMLDGLVHIANEICEVINADLIPRMIQLNFGPRGTYPKLKQSGISDKAGIELANMLKTLGDAKWLTPEDGDEEHLRRRIGLPARTGIGERETPNPGGIGGIAGDDSVGVAKAATLSEIQSAVQSGNLTLSEKMRLADAAYILRGQK